MPEIRVSKNKIEYILTETEKNKAHAQEAIKQVIKGKDTSNLNQAEMRGLLIELLKIHGLF